jgi:hypothetical protein
MVDEGYDGPMKPVDPRAWNIVAGLWLASGCGSRTIEVEGSGTDAGESTESSSESSSESNSESSSTLETPPECVTDSDCGYSYQCVQGECEYYSSSRDCHGDGDGDYWYDCNTDIDCNAFELCYGGTCEPLASPSACMPPAPVPSLAIPVAALALSFVDVDADGADELVIATPSELQVYESASDVPLVSLRVLDSDSIDAMVGGPFDAMAGDDVMILFADELRLHASDGAGSFAAPSVSLSDWPDSIGLLAGEFDGEAPADLLLWGNSGAGVRLGSGDTFPLSDDVITVATARSLDDPSGGFALLRGQSILAFFNTDGTIINEGSLRPGSPNVLTSVSPLGSDLSSSVVSEWTVIEQWAPTTGYLLSRWGVLGQVTAMAGGDFDGDSASDVALIVDGAVQINFGVASPMTCLASYPFASSAVAVAVGDHDGDGDDELAVQFEAGDVVVLDGE